MPLMVRFRASTGTWLVPVDHVLEVRLATTVRPLPDPVDGVAGVVERDGRTLPVLTTLGPGDRHVIVLRTDGELLGVLTDEVVGVVDVAPGLLRPPPLGQERPFVTATAGAEPDLSYVLDPAQLVHVLDRSTTEAVA